MSYARIDEIEEIAKRQGRSIGISHPSYFAAAALSKQNGIEDVETVNTAKDNRITEQKITDTTFLAKIKNEQQTGIPNEEQAPAFAGQHNYEAMLKQIFHLGNFA